MTEKNMHAKKGSGSISTLFDGWWKNPFGSEKVLSDKKDPSARTTAADAAPDATEKDSDEIENPFGSMKDIISSLGGGAENPFSSGKSDARKAADKSTWWKNPFGSMKDYTSALGAGAENPFSSEESDASDELDYMDDAQASDLEDKLAETKRDIAKFERRLERRRKRREGRGNRNPISRDTDSPITLNSEAIDTRRRGSGRDPDYPMGR